MCDRGDLIEREVAVEPKHDHVPLRIRERPDRRQDGGPVFVVEGDCLGIVVRGERRRTWVDGLAVQRDDVPACYQSRYRGSDGDPAEPGPERAVAPERGERLVCLCERVLSGVLGLDRIAQDPAADPDHGLGLAFDQHPKGLTVSGENGIDDLAVAYRRFQHDRSRRASRCGAWWVSASIIARTYPGVIPGWRS